ncbi:MAG: hypothetical protein EPO68_05870, partial [Planctomycetota bacterium]
MSRQVGFRRLACAALGALLALPLTATPRVSIDGKPNDGKKVVEAAFHAGKRPDGLSAEAAAALARIERWKCEREYAVSACADERVLYVSALEGKARAARVALIEKLC